MSAGNNCYLFVYPGLAAALYDLSDTGGTLAEKTLVPFKAIAERGRLWGEFKYNCKKC